MRCARDVICNAECAEYEGFGAFGVGQFQDAGLYEARLVVHIPMLAPPEVVEEFRNHPKGL
jgi:allantoin racemase